MTYRAKNITTLRRKNQAVFWKKLNQFHQRLRNRAVMWVNLIIECFVCGEKQKFMRRNYSFVPNDFAFLRLPEGLPCVLPSEILA
jgi:hypothetical protein